MLALLCEEETLLPGESGILQLCVILPDCLEGEGVGAVGEVEGELAALAVGEVVGDGGGSGGGGGLCGGAEEVAEGGDEGGRRTGGE